MELGGGTANSVDLDPHLGSGEAASPRLSRGAGHQHFTRGGCHPGVTKPRSEVRVRAARRASKSALCATTN